MFAVGLRYDVRIIAIIVKLNEMNEQRVTSPETDRPHRTRKHGGFNYSNSDRDFGNHVPRTPSSGSETIRVFNDGVFSVFNLVIYLYCCYGVLILFFVQGTASASGDL